MINLIFDFETTGLPKHPTAKPEIQPRAIEFAGILAGKNGDEIDCLELLINPEQPLEEVITKITGLTDEDLEDQPTFIEQQETIRSFFERADNLIAHNLPFDSNILQLELDRNGIDDWPWPRHNTCTVAELAPEWGRRVKLIDAYKFYTGDTFKQEHRALSDVRALLRLAHEIGALL